MNDRFLFRVVNKETKKYEHPRDVEESSVFLLSRVSSKYIVEQCTGLKDKNGKLIYEGDIVKIPDNYEEYGFMSGEKREVYFKEGGFRLKPKDKKFLGYWLEYTKELEVIGNIHENPELLKSVTNCNQLEVDK